MYNNYDWFEKAMEINCPKQKVMITMKELILTELDKIAKKRNLTRSAAINEAVAIWIATVNAIEKEKENGKNRIQK